MIPPTMRKKRRYIKLRLEGNFKLTEKEARDEIYGAILSFLGEFGFSKANPKLVEFRDNSAVLVCSNSEIQNVKAALALTNRVKDEQGCIRVVKVSGMLTRVKI